MSTREAGKKKRKKRRYNPKKHARPQQSPAVSHLRLSMNILHEMKPVIDVVQRIQARRREQAQSTEAE